MSRDLQRRFAEGDVAAADLLRSEYDRQADQWLTWTATQPDYLVPLVDALARGETGTPEVVLEIGAGAGPASDLLAARFPGRVIALDLAWKMLVRNRAPVQRVQADVVALPMLDRCVDLVVAVNGVLRWSEVRRVLRPAGRVLVVSSFGSETPLYTSLDQIMVAWSEADIRMAHAGHGDWLVVRA